MSKAPSPAQLAARAKFAAAARSGEFKRKAGAVKARKRNPVPPKTGDGPEYFARVKGRGWVVGFQRNAPVHVWQYSKNFADATILGEGQAVQVKTMCDHCSAACELVSVKDNPLTRVRVKSPSMATGAPPSKRLTKRRKATNKAPAGYYANPDYERSGSAGVRANEAALRSRLAQLVKLLKAPAWPAIGALGFDKTMAGWMLVQMRSAGGAEADLSDRLKAGEMLTFLDGALLVAKAR
jgi:hypothetical protein